MDKVRAFLRVVWTQRFWVLIIIGIIVGAMSWNMAASDLSASFDSRKSKIEQAHNAVKGIKNEPIHPNEAINSGDMKEAKKQKSFVLTVWQNLYEAQRDKVLYWPKSLGPQFIEELAGKKFGDSISKQMRERYLNYIENRFEGLLKIVDAKKNKERGARGGGYGGEMGGYGSARGAEGDIVEDDYLVQWIDQDKVRMKLMFKDIPTDIQVWVTQEDLWVIETLLEVISNTNKARGATRPDNTAVRAIVALQVGSEASGKSMSKVFIPQPKQGAEGGEMGGYGGEMGGYGGEMGGYGGYGGEMGGYGGEMGGYGGEMGGYGGEMGGYGGEMGGYGGEMGGYGGRGGVAGGGGPGGSVTNRYLDADGNPDPGTSGTYGTAEFRKLPVRMQLMMDQRWIPRILIECANAALPVEVEQLRINPNQSSQGFAGRSRPNSRARALQGIEPDPNLADVEIRGVVYIYNEPDTAELAIPGDTDPGTDATTAAAGGSPDVADLTQR